MTRKRILYVDDGKMGMFDIIYNVPVKCPRCTDERPKSVQIKSGPQNLLEYEFGPDLIRDAKKKGEIKAPEDGGYLFQCEIEGKSALGVLLKRLDDVYNGNRNIELFEVAIWLNKENVPIAVDQIVELNEEI